MHHGITLGLSALLIVAPTAALTAQGTLAPDGAALFRTRCASCHTVVPGARATLGPSLAGIANRRAGSTTFNYSPAMRASNIVWTEASLNRFLAGPARMLPGTRMVIAVSDPAQRSVIIKFIIRPQSR